MQITLGEVRPWPKVPQRHKSLTSNHFLKSQREESMRALVHEGDEGFRKGNLFYKGLVSLTSKPCQIIKLATLMHNFFSLYF